MRVAVSIKLGKITPSTLLRRLGSASRKNKMHYAFRELGRVVRANFLLRYIADPALRQTIHAETNKAEEFHNFAKWAFLGGEGIMAENVRHEQREIVKYNHPVANIVALNTLHRMTKAIQQLQRSGRIVVTEKLVAAQSPYRTIHINRYGDYLLDVSRRVEPKHRREVQGTATRTQWPALGAHAGKIISKKSFKISYLAIFWRQKLS